MSSQGPEDQGCLNVINLEFTPNDQNKNIPTALEPLLTRAETHIIINNKYYAMSSTPTITVLTNNHEI